MHVELKRLPAKNLEAALAKAAHYRDLNQPEEAESICRDVLDVEPKNQVALRLLGLALTDQLVAPGVARTTGGQARGGSPRGGHRGLREARDRLRPRLPRRGRLGAGGEGAPRAQRGAQRGDLVRARARISSSAPRRSARPTRPTRSCAGTGACGSSRPTRCSWPRPASRATKRCTRANSGARARSPTPGGHFGLSEYEVGRPLGVLRPSRR